MFLNHAHAFIDKIHNVKLCDNNHILTLFDVSHYVLPSEIELFRNDKHNLNNCNGCKTQYNEILKQAEIFYSRFPNCCNWHKKLNQLSLFVKSDFIDGPRQVADKTMAAFHHIINHIDTDDWEEEIQNYLEYIIASCGQFPKGHGVPFGLDKILNYLDALLKNYKFSKEEEIYKKRFDVVFRIIDDLTVVDVKKSNKRDFNMLIEIYNKWFSMFPFSVEFFEPLKLKYSKTFPFLEGPFEFNPYLKTAKSKIISAPQLVQYLNKITIDVLQSIDTSKMVEDNYIADKNKYNIDLIKNKHSFDQKLIFNQFSKGEKQYVKTIKKWLENEKAFIAEILKDLPVNTIKKENTKKASYIKNNEGVGFKLVKVSSTDAKFADFHNSLKHAGYILADLNTFRNAFVGNSGYKNIHWLKDQNELNYLISNLIKLKIIKNYGAWVHAINVFLLGDGSSIHNEIRTNSYSGIHKVLDKAVGNLI